MTVTGPSGVFLAFSKYATGGFPEFEKLALAIQDFAKTGTAPSTWKATAAK